MDVLVIAGPTASGKTALALALAQKMPVEIINMDSALVYRGMDIGTAKPSLAERQRVVHHLIDICDVREHYSAADFVRDAEQLVAQIKARNHLPVVVGGTLLYLHSWLNGLSDLPSADAALRSRLQAQWEHDPEEMHARLTQLDPIAGARIHPNDPQRIMRALEVIELTGVSLTELQQQRQTTSLDIRVVFIDPPNKAWLHQRIEQRWQQMRQQALLHEVSQVMQQTQQNMTLPAMRCVGYRQVAQFLLGEIDEATLDAQALSATRNLAKRQMTWMKRLTPHLRLQADHSVEQQLMQLQTWLLEVYPGIQDKMDSISLP